MNPLFETILDFLKNPKYPELFAFFGILVFLLATDISTAYFIATCLLLATGAFITAYSIAFPEHDFNYFLITVLLNLTIVLLKFNYIPAFLLCLLIFSRIILVDKEYTISLIIVNLIIGILATLSTSFLLPELAFSESEQHTLNFISLMLVTIAIAYKFYAFIQLIEYYEEEKFYHQLQHNEQLQVINHLSRFLPLQVGMAIIQSKGDFRFRVQRHKLTILFSDIVGFTRLSDNISPDELSNILNTYMEKMTEIAYRYGATLDKFMGDGLLCFFGDSGNRSERDNAVLCAKMAIEMRREMQVLSRNWRLLGFEGLSLRIGINTGYCYVGSFGSIKRSSYTLIGKEANLASRLETASRPNQILISDTTYNLIRHSQFCQIIGDIEVKGFDERVKVWELLDPDPNRGYVVDNRWLDYDLPGFNIHLNFEEIRNYDKQQIIDHLTNALDVVKQSKQN